MAARVSALRDRPGAHSRYVSFDDGAFPENHYPLDCPHGLAFGQHVWIWLDGHWREAIVQSDQQRMAWKTYVRMAPAIS